MKTSWLSLLRAIMTLIYFFTWMSAILAPIAFFVFADKEQTSFENFGVTIFNVHWTFYVVLGLSIIGYFLFLAMIFHLKKVAYRITPKRFIDNEIKNHFYKAGLFCVMGALLTKIPAVVYKYSTLVIVKNKKVLIKDASLQLGISFDSVLVILAFGIFLIIVSKIIAQSIELKIENDLTI
jgi:hypothetical protein